ncbi:MAG: hypothetical protein ABSB40_07185 [Nitrososphaeria archaeon]|jgi:hypothetical protein
MKQNVDLKVLFLTDLGFDKLLGEGLLQDALNQGFSSMIITKELKKGESPIQQVNSLILSADIVVTVVGDYVPSNLLCFETNLVRKQSKPLVVCIPYRQVPFDTSSSINRLFEQQINRLFEQQIIFYKNEDELRKGIISALNSISKSLLTEEYVTLREEENRSFSDLKKTLGKNVLVLGKDSDVKILGRMQRIKEVLKSRGYEPRFLRDYEDIDWISVRGKMIRIGALCRFMVAEDSRPSGAILELEVCVNIEYVTAVVREVGFGSTKMVSHFPNIHRLIHTFCYKTEQSQKVIDKLCEEVYPTLEDSVYASIEWAEKQIKILEGLYSNTLY